MKTTGLSCKHISRVTRSPRAGISGVCSLPANLGRRCGPGMPLCPLFDDRREREIPFSDSGWFLEAES